MQFCNNFYFICIVYLFLYFWIKTATKPFYLVINKVLCIVIKSRFYTQNIIITKYQLSLYSESQLMIYVVFAKAIDVGRHAACHDVKAIRSQQLLEYTFHYIQITNSQLNQIKHMYYVTLTLKRRKFAFVYLLPRHTNWAKILNRHRWLFPGLGY